ncbi:hypothetical protein RchiOBHm_Chr1g0379581 [Rosa chinensis]|uniref:Uncharacterized protein n=1 Tax=Rosa chinensis TaxID=74649 RepID=A0A2P6SNP8_ROSCH|nr:hypothetical protein RchiOBHm_Chr1g0379581 [Rosa chinensis]
MEHGKVIWGKQVMVDCFGIIKVLFWVLFAPIWICLVLLQRRSWQLLKQYN